MEKIGWTLSLLFSVLLVYGQQTLWTTSQKESESHGLKYLPMANVTQQALEYYDFYGYYFDLTGFSKKRFLEEIAYGFDEVDWLLDINDLTVFAIKSNTGRASIIALLLINMDKVDIILFSNDLTAFENPQGTLSFNREKFAQWFNTLLD